MTDTPEQMRPPVNTNELRDYADTLPPSLSDPLRVVANELDDTRTDRNIARQRIAELEAALRKVKRGPVKPLPDAGAHSWEAFGRAAFQAMRDLQRIASQALAAGPSGLTASLLDPASPESEATPEPLEWLIRKSGYFYRPNKRGYTSSLHEAGRYTESDAKSEAAVEPNNMTAIHIRELKDITPEPDAGEVERVARAICAQPITEALLPTWRRHERQARAAISAMEARHD